MPKQWIVSYIRRTTTANKSNHIDCELPGRMEIIMWLYKTGKCMNKIKKKSKYSYRMLTTAKSSGTVINVQTNIMHSAFSIHPFIIVSFTRIRTKHIRTIFNISAIRWRYRTELFEWYNQQMDGNEFWRDCTFFTRCALFCREISTYIYYVRCTV